MMRKRPPAIRGRGMGNSGAKHDAPGMEKKLAQILNADKSKACALAIGEFTGHMMDCAKMNLPFESFWEGKGMLSAGKTSVATFNMLFGKEIKPVTEKEAREFYNTLLKQARG